MTTCFGCQAHRDDHLPITDHEPWCRSVGSGAPEGTATRPAASGASDRADEATPQTQRASVGHLSLVSPNH